MNNKTKILLRVLLGSSIVIIFLFFIFLSFISNNNDTPSTDTTPGTLNAGAFSYDKVNNISNLGKTANESSTSIYNDASSLVCKQNDVETIIYSSGRTSINIINDYVLFVDETKHLYKCNMDGSDSALLEGFENYILDRVWANEKGCFFRLSDKDDRYPNAIVYASFDNPSDPKYIGPMEGFCLAIRDNYAYFIEEGGSNINQINLDNLNDYSCYYYIPDDQKATILTSDGTSLYVCTENYSNNNSIGLIHIYPDPNYRESTSIDLEEPSICTSFNIYEDTFYMGIINPENKEGYVGTGVKSTLFDQYEENKLTIIDSISNVSNIKIEIDTNNGKPIYTIY